MFPARRDTSGASEVATRESARGARDELGAVFVAVGGDGDALISPTSRTMTTMTVKVPPPLSSSVSTTTAMMTMTTMTMKAPSPLSSSMSTTTAMTMTRSCRQLRGR